MDGKESLPYLGEAKWSHKRMVKVLALGYWTVRPVEPSTGPLHFRRPLEMVGRQAG